VAPKTRHPEPLAGPIVNLKFRTAHRLLLIPLSIFFALGLIEFPAFINVIDYRVLLGANFAWWPRYNINDPELIHIRRPYAHFSGETRGGGATIRHAIPPSDMTLYRWDVKCDHNGFRNEQDLKSADMAVIGDSFVEGLTVPYDELTTSLLAQLRGEVVANLGQSAYGPQQELVLLKRYALPLRPRTVVWMFSEGTDLDDVVYYDRVMHDPPDFLHAFWARSFTKIMYFRLFHGSKSPGIKCAGILETPDSKRVTIYFPKKAQPLSKQDLSAIDETTHILAEANDLCATHGARLIVVFVPEKFRVFQPVCRFPQQSDCRNWAPNDLPERFERAVRSISSEIGYLDLTPSLVDAARKGAVPYYPDDDHWSPEGHKIAAEAINGYLSSRQSP
jgi:hypothetical protein